MHELWFFYFNSVATVYILYSESIDRFYIGSCLDLKLRLEEHRTKKYSSAFTATTDDWTLFLVLENLDYRVARKIETHIKRMKSRTYIQNLKKYPQLLEKLQLSIAGSSR